MANGLCLLVLGADPKGSGGSTPDDTEVLMQYILRGNHIDIQELEACLHPTLGNSTISKHLIQAMAR